MSSAVYARSGTDILVGDEAIDDPAGFLAAPKRMLTGGETVFEVAGRQIAARTVVAAVVSEVLARAGEQHDGQAPCRLVLTHPEGWGPQQTQVLRDAAEQLGFDDERVVLVPEPRAAAAYYTRDAAPTAGTRLVVFDLGAGTLDVAVLVARAAGGFAVVAAGGDNALGGRNFDAAIRRA
jgi:molecular chaperone DnaK (HSP70)